MKNFKNIIIGGGAAGLLAAIFIKKSGQPVVVLERNARVGKKILATGNGRCNYTNVGATREDYYSDNPDFVEQVLQQFSPQEVISFFEDLGIAHKVEEEGKVFPMSDQASSVLDVLRYELDEENVLCNAFVKEIGRTEGGYRLELEDGRQLLGKTVLIATGGKAMPSTGSDGNGYRLAEQLGHRITPLRPSLVQLMLAADGLQAISGVKFKGVATLMCDGKTIQRESGDVLFANYGVSGPPILQLSAVAGALIEKNKQPSVSLNLLPEFEDSALLSHLYARFHGRPDKPLAFALIGLINKRLIPRVIRAAGIASGQILAGSLSNREMKALADIMQNWTFPIRGTKSWPSAQVTAGGVDTAEIDPTMASTKHPGLYFAGEVVDVDGRCGGYNLHWAWVSAAVAAENMVSR